MRPMKPPRTLCEYDENLGYIWHELMNDAARRYALIAITLVLLSSGILVTIPYAIGFYIDGLTTGEPALLLAGGAAFCGFAITTMLLGWFGQHVRERFFQIAFWYMPQQITAQYLARPLSWLSGGSSEIDGSGVSSLQQRVWNITGSYIFSIIPGWGVIVFSVIACLYANIWLGLIATTFVAIEQYFARRANLYIHRELKPVIDGFKRWDRRMNERWRNVDHVKAQGGETKVLQLMEDEIQESLKGDDAVWRIYFNWFILRHRLRSFGFGLALYALVGYLVLNDVLGLAVAVLVFFSFERIRVALVELTNQQRDVQFDMTSLDKYRRVLQQPVPFHYNEGEEFTDPTISVTFENVTHHVTDKKGQKEILRNVNLHIPVGTKVGVVGLSGAGKSQLLSLLLRASDPTSGRILVNDTDLTTIRPESLKRQMPVIMQKSEPNEGTILDSLLDVLTLEDMPSMFCELPEEKQAWLVELATQSLRKAGLEPEQFDDGIYTNIGYKGLTLSGGQQQRLQIAAAHLKILVAKSRDRNCFVLPDEPTAALDSLSEVTVMQHLQNELPENTTMLMVAHRLSTVANMDKIVFVRPLDRCDDNTTQVTIHDSLAELYRSDPLFREMADAQEFVPEGIKHAA